MAIPWSVPLHGDSEAGCVDILRTDPDFVAAFPGCTVSTDLIGYQAGMQWVEVSRKGGNLGAWQKSDKPRMDFYIFGPNRADALDMANLVQRSMFMAQGNYRGKGIALVAVTVETGITRIPDTITDAARYLLSLRLTVVPE